MTPTGQSENRQHQFLANSMRRLLRLCEVSHNKDERSIAHYRAYHAGKYLGLGGSLIICLGLMTWFIVRSSNNNISPVTLAITSIGIVLFLLGVFFFFKAAYHTFKAQSRDAAKYKNPGAAPFSATTSGEGGGGSGAAGGGGGGSNINQQS